MMMGRKNSAGLKNHTKPCGRGLAPVQTGDIVYISNRGHGLQANTHDQEVTDHALEPRVPHESKNQAGS